MDVGRVGVAPAAETASGTREMPFTGDWALVLA